jgi:hypothetical protein
MRKITTYFKALFSLGPLGLVILLLAITILFAARSQTSEPFDAALERMDILDTLENKVTFNLNEMQLQEVREMFAVDYELSEEDSAQKALDADTEISQELSTLEEDGRFGSEFPYATDITSELQDFNDTRAAHQKIFKDAISAFESGNEDNAVSTMDQFEENKQTLDSQLRALIISVEHDRLSALKDFPDDADVGVLYAAIGLALCLILALFGYQVITSTVRPLRYLRNTITAIGGDQYRPETQIDLLKRGDAAGNLARALDQLATGEQTRNEGIKQEVERLRQELYESRRRRLKVFHTTEKPE